MFNGLIFIGFDNKQRFNSHNLSDHIEVFPCQEMAPGFSMLLVLDCIYSGILNCHGNNLYDYFIELC